MAKAKLDVDNFLDQYDPQITKAAGSQFDVDNFLDQYDPGVKREGKWKSVVSNLPEHALAGGEQAMGGTMAVAGAGVNKLFRTLRHPEATEKEIALTEHLGLPLAKLGSEIAESGRRERKGIGPEEDLTLLQRGVSTAAESAVPMALALLTGNPYLGAAAIGVMTGGSSYEEAISQQKLDQQTAALHAIGIGVIESATELLPFTRILPDTAKQAAKSLGRKAAEFLVTEVPGEQLATLGQGLLEVLAGMRDDPSGKLKTVADYVTKDLPKEELDTLVATLVMAGPTICA